MNPKIFPFFCLLVGIVILNLGPTCLVAQNENYATCGKSYSCANLQNVSYPFWGGGRPEICGHPSFGLTCSGDAALITLKSGEYRVLSINYDSSNLVVVADEFWNNPCPKYPYNTSFDTDHFSYSSGYTPLELFYGCPANQSTTVGVTYANAWTCSTNDTNTTSYYLTTSANSAPTSVTCETSVSVRVNGTAAEALGQNTPTMNISQAVNGGFGLDWKANDSSYCSPCVGSGGLCGSNSSSGGFACYCSDQAYPRVCGSNSTTVQNGGDRKKVRHGLRSTWILVLGLSIGMPIIIIFLLKTMKHLKGRYRWNESLDDQNVEAFIRNCGFLTPKRYKYSEISRITKSFKDKLGEGGYGSVYKGKLPDGRLVAVKILSEAKGNGEEFINEVAAIGRTSHINVVALLGFCYQKNKRALIYEFMVNGSLDKFISNDGFSGTDSLLDLATLNQIAVSIARGLEYLHRGCSTRIVHFDIKPHNILLDKDFCPKISDFGMAKLCKKEKSIISMVGTRGTIGYIAPEVFSRTFSEVSHKSDVYSYGMLILEMAGTRRNIEVVQTSDRYFPDWIYGHLENAQDLTFHTLTAGEEEETVRKMILVGLWCIQTIPSDRPTMSKVVEMLEGSIQSLKIPPKPLLFSSAGPDPIALGPSKSFSTGSAVDLDGTSQQLPKPRLFAPAISGQSTQDSCSSTSEFH